MRTPAETMPKPRARRLFSAAYDSVTQRELRGRTDESVEQRAVQRAILVSRLRLDLILSGRVVVTDSMLLDGALFGAVCPSDLAKDISITPWSDDSLVVRMRSESLEDCLLGLVTDEQTGMLRAFEFSIVDESERQRLTSFLASEVDRGADAPSTLLELERLFRAANISEEQRSKVFRHWRHWIEFLDSPSAMAPPIIRRETFSKGSLNMLAAVERHEADFPTWDQDAQHPQSTSRVLDEIRSGLELATPRSLLYRVVEDGIRDGYDRILAKQYIDRVFGFAMSEQHACEDVAAGWTLPLRPVATGGGARRGSEFATLEQLATAGLATVEMPSDFLARLALASREDLRVWAIEEAAALDVWRDERDGGSSLRSAMAHLEEVLAERVSPQRVDLELLGRIPETRRWTRWARLNQTIKRYGPATGAEGLGIAADAAGLGGLRTIVSLVAGPARSAAQRRMGNPAIITTDIAVPRRRKEGTSNGRPTCG